MLLGIPLDLRVDEDDRLELWLTPLTDERDDVDAEYETEATLDRDPVLEVRLPEFVDDARDEKTGDAGILELAELRDETLPVENDREIDDEPRPPSDEESDEAVELVRDDELETDPEMDDVLRAEELTVNDCENDEAADELRALLDVEPDDSDPIEDELEPRDALCDPEDVAWLLDSEEDAERVKDPVLEERELERPPSDVDVLAMLDISGPLLSDTTRLLVLLEKLIVGKAPPLEWRTMFECENGNGDEEPQTGPTGVDEGRPGIGPELMLESGRGPPY